MTDYPRNKPHLFIDGRGRAEQYRPPPGGGGRVRLPELNQEAHGADLSQAITLALGEARQQLLERKKIDPNEEKGFYLEFDVSRKQPEAFDKFANRKKGIELIAVKESKTDNEPSTVTVFVPETAENHFQKKIEEYRYQNKPSGAPKNEALVACIEAVRLAKFKSLYNDDESLIPTRGESIWWEIWLRKGQQDRFKRDASRLEIRIKDYFRG